MWSIYAAYQEIYLAFFFIGMLLNGIIFAVVCYKIAEGKGYPESLCDNAAVGGYFFSWIWLVVTICEPVIPVSDRKHIQKESAITQEQRKTMSDTLFFILVAIAMAFMVGGIITSFFSFSAGEAAIFLSVSLLMLIYWRV